MDTELEVAIEAEDVKVLVLEPVALIESVDDIDVVEDITDVDVFDD